MIFALFDDFLDPNVKEMMARPLHATPRPLVFNSGKPDFPAVIDNPSMDQFVGQKSWLLFHLLGTNGDWLAMPADQWIGDHEYCSMRDIVTKLEVVNDIAERGVKDTQEFSNAAGDGAHRERIILVSNSHRIKLPGYTKREMEESI